MKWRVAVVMVLAAICVAEHKQEEIPLPTQADIEEAKAFIAKANANQNARAVRAEVISCDACSLDRLTEVKAFIFEDVPLYHNVEFVKAPGKPATIAFYDATDKEFLRVPLSDHDREGCNQILLKRGFFKRAHKDDPVPEEYAEGTKKMEL